MDQTCGVELRARMGIRACVRRRPT